MAFYVSDIIDEILEDLNESTTDPQHITRAKVLKLLNRCQRQLCQKELVVADSYQAVVLTTSIDTYPIDEDAWSVMYGIYDSEPIEIVTEEQLNQYKINWREDTGEPWFLLWEFKQPRSITVYKTPTSTEAGTYLYLQNYMADLNALVDSDSAETGQLPFALRNEWDAFYHFGMWKAQSLRSPLTDTKSAVEHRDFYLARVRELQTKAPKRLTIVGRLGAKRPYSRGPSLPDDYPRLSY